MAEVAVTNKRGLGSAPLFYYRFTQSFFCQAGSALKCFCRIPIKIRRELSGGLDKIKEIFIGEAR